MDEKELFITVNIDSISINLPIVTRDILSAFLHHADLFTPHNPTKLNNLCDQYGSDKGSNIFQLGGACYQWPSHTYTQIYNFLLSPIRNSIKNVLEVGIGTNHTDTPSNMGATGAPGASLKVWRDFFPNAKIFGFDIDHRILFEDTRLKTFQCDQTDSVSVMAAIEKTGVDFFDLIIDDGLHTFHAGKNLFESAFQKLTPDGYYFIEDVNQADLIKYSVYFRDRVDCIPFFFMLHRKPVPLGDNNLIVIRKTSSPF